MHHPSYEILYIANIRLPTEKAHGLQIVQNCEAFADAGVDVTLWQSGASTRPNYAPSATFGRTTASCAISPCAAEPCLDLIPLVPDRVDRLAQLLFLIQLWTFSLAALIGGFHHR